MKTGPDFLCIGAPKCGTSWLHRQMLQHPELWLPIVKELHYFDARFPLPVTGTKANQRAGLFGLYRRYPRDKLLRTWFKALRAASPADLAWCHRYFGGAQDDAWYLELFRRPDSMLSGDFTTAYCALSGEAVRHVRRLLPEVRVLFLMRHPVDRAWSHARMLVPKLLGKPLEAVTEDDFARYLSHPAAQRRGRYVDTLRTWEAVFPAEQLFIGFFDDIAQRPAALLRDIYGFVGVDARPDSLPPDLEKPVNVGNRRVARGIPDRIQTLLTELYRDDVAALKQRFGEAIANWA
ncbi:MAG: sulfotransferase [Pseudomonadota bacterium]